MEKCKHFDYCNAPICPKDKDRNLRVYLNGEERCRRKDLSKPKNKKK